MTEFEKYWEKFEGDHAGFIAEFASETLEIFRLQMQQKFEQGQENGFFQEAFEAGKAATVFPPGERDVTTRLSGGWRESRVVREDGEQ